MSKKDDEGELKGIMDNYNPTPLGTPNRIPLVHRIPGPTIVNEPLSKEERRKAKKAAELAEFEKLLGKHSVTELVATASGLPARVRALYKRIDKLSKHGTSYVDILDEVRPIVAKYLTHRMDVAVFGVTLLRREMEKHTDPTKIRDERDVDPALMTNTEVLNLLENIKKMMRACAEADSLMLLRAEYFLIGLTTRFCAVVSTMKEPVHPGMIALQALIDLGNETAGNRHQRVLDATKALHELGVEVP